MLCTVCNQQRELNELMFVEDGMVPGTTIKKHNAVCKYCQTGKEPPEEKWTTHAEASQPREPGSDDDVGEEEPLF